MSIAPVPFFPVPPNFSQKFLDKLIEIIFEDADWFTFEAHV